MNDLTKVTNALRKRADSIDEEADRIYAAEIRTTDLDEVPVLRRIAAEFRNLADEIVSA